jgi:hypothetical protein
MAADRSLPGSAERYGHQFDIIACSSKTSGSPAGTSRSGSGSPSTRHHPAGHTRPAQQANHHPTRARCQCLLKTVCVPLVITDGQSYRMKDAQHRKENPQPT